MEQRRVILVGGGLSETFAGLGWWQGGFHPRARVNGLGVSLLYIFFLMVDWIGAQRIWKKVLKQSMVCEVEM